MSDTLATLQAEIESRKNASPDRSYVAYLHSRGLNKILEKIGEESTEVILAAKDVNPESGAQALIEETADLLCNAGDDYEEQCRKIKVMLDNAKFELEEAKLPVLYL